MSRMPPVTEQTKEKIHFETLLDQADQEIARQGGQVWTDRAEHDPGQTLLQALCYNVSDLSYRHLLPLKDLLARAEENGFLFPEQFGPHQVLTCSPLTIDDYRRGILDLCDADGHPFFVNVQIKPVIAGDEEIYRYFYDPQARRFSFTGSEGALPQFLFGDYIVCVERQNPWNALPPAGSTAFDEFLQHHRNLGEGFARIHVADPKTHQIYGDIEVADDVMDVLPIMAQVYRMMLNFACPSSIRKSPSELAQLDHPSEDIFQGPAMRHGWIAALPADINYFLPSGAYRYINVAPLVSMIEGIEGVKSVLNMRGDGTIASPNLRWLIGLQTLQACRLWDDSYPASEFAVGNKIRFIKHGRRMVVTREQFYAALDASEPEKIVNEPVTMTAGKARNTSYHAATLRLPACYQLQHPEPDQRQQRLHRFLLAFEQELANRCDQLARLPELLAFVRTAAAGGVQVRGARWPFTDDDERNAVSNAVHAAYREVLEAFNTDAAGDRDKELEIINYLLGYFGAERAARTLLPSGTDDFMTVQRGYLARMPELGYDRARIQIDQVSAIQRRIAARLGWAPQLFMQDSPDLSTLPFYVVERRQLLPTRPAAAYDDDQTPEDVMPGEGDSLSLAVASGVTLQRGQVLEFVLLDEAGSELETIGPNLIRDVDGAQVNFLLSDNQRLERNVDRIIAAQEEGKLRWRNSGYWLQGMEFSIEKAEAVSGQAKQRKVTSNVLTPDLRGDEQLMFYRLIGGGAEKPGNKKTLLEVRAKLISVDALTGAIVAEAGDAADWAGLDSEPTRWRWYVKEEDEAVPDRFSFAVSVVFNRALLEGAEVVDKVAVAEWIARIVNDEMPANITPYIHWLSSAYFRDFAGQYGNWQNDGNPLGDVSYRLLELLAIGQLRDDYPGIGARHIATDAERKEAVGQDGSEWHQDYIDGNDLIYVPRADAEDTAAD